MFSPRGHTGFIMAVLLAAAMPARAQTPATDPSAALFDDSVLHEIRITISERDWAALKANYLLNTYYPCDLKWKDQVVRNVGVRSRGTGTRSPVKPHLGIDFGRFVSGQRFLGLKAFVLRNNLQDPSQGLRERLSLTLFRRMGEPASRLAHSRLYVNESYVGLYSIVESIDSTFTSRAYGESDGFLYSMDPGENGYYFEYLGPDPAAYVPKPFKAENHSSNPEPEVLERLAWAVNYAGDHAFRAALSSFFDVRALLRHVAIDMFTGDNDGLAGNWGTNNVYLYRFEGTQRFGLLPWDKSNTFMDGPEYPIWHNIYDVAEPLRNRLLARVLQFDDFRGLYLDSLLECATAAAAYDSSDVSRPAHAWLERPRKPGPNWLEHEILGGYQQIREAAHADPVAPYTVAQFDQEVAKLLEFARVRSAFVAREVERSRQAVRRN